jgi:hypothetical protein
MFRYLCVGVLVSCHGIDATNKNDGFFVESRRKAQQ